MKHNPQDLFRSLPQVSSYLASEAGRVLADEFGEGVTKLLLRSLLEELRLEIRSGERIAPLNISLLTETLHRRLERFQGPDSRRAINATGVILHTGLGRAPLSQRALSEVSSPGYSLVQVERETGGRSNRDKKIELMLKELTGCEAVMTVNNNAAATFLMINEVAHGKEVIISRGQLIEIGGSFRMPEVMEQSGAILREVGTTNRTHLSDYEKAINENTGAILHVHPSNYQVRGFSGTPSIYELVELGKRYNIPVLADLGSGAIFPLREFGLSDVTTIREALEVGALVTCSSGDKLICGPQAGILCGKLNAIERMRKNPFARMFRTDKLCLAALEATLTSYVNDTYRADIPLYQMLSTSITELEQRAAMLVQAIGELPDWSVGVQRTQAYVGGGSLPDESLSSTALTLSPKVPSAAEKLSRKLRCDVPAVFCRLHEGVLLFDLRTVSPDEDEQLACSIRKCIATSDRSL